MARDGLRLGFAELGRQARAPEGGSVYEAWVRTGFVSADKARMVAPQARVRIGCLGARCECRSRRGESWPCRRTPLARSLARHLCYLPCIVLLHRLYQR